MEHTRHLVKVRGEEKWLRWSWRKGGYVTTTFRILATRFCDRSDAQRKAAAISDVPFELVAEEA